MEGMVMEVFDDSVIVITPEGKFLEIPHTKSVSVGEQIPIYNIREFKPKQTVLKKFIPLAASFLMIAVLGFAGYGYSNVFGYVTVDINPSTVISYNWFHRTMDVDGLNTDGEFILMKMGSLKNKSLEDTVNAIIETSEEEGFLGEDGSHQVLISASDKSSSHRSQSILEDVNEAIELPADIDYVVVNGNAESYNYIKSKGASPILVILEDTLSDEELEDIIIQSSKPVKEILKEEKEEAKEQKAIEKQEQKEEKQEQIEQKQEQKQEEIQQKKEELEQQQEEKQQQIEDKKEEKQQQIEDKKEEKENPGQGSENSNNGNSNGVTPNAEDEDQINEDNADSSSNAVDPSTLKENNNNKEKNTTPDNAKNEQSNNDGGSSEKKNDKKTANQGGSNKKNKNKN